MPIPIHLPDIPEPEGGMLSAVLRRVAERAGLIRDELIRDVVGAGGGVEASAPSGAQSAW